MNEAVGIGPNMLALLIALIMWLIRTFVRPAAPLIDPEFAKAAKAVHAAADKWGGVADLFTTWHLPAAFALGIVVAVVLTFVFSRKKS